MLEQIRDKLAKDNGLGKSPNFQLGYFMAMMAVAMERDNPKALEEIVRSRV